MVQCWADTGSSSRNNCGRICDLMAHSSLIPVACSNTQCDPMAHSSLIFREQRYCCGRCPFNGAKRRAWKGDMAHGTNCEAIKQPDSASASRGATSPIADPASEAVVEPVEPRSRTVFGLAPGTARLVQASGMRKHFQEEPSGSSRRAQTSGVVLNGTWANSDGIRFEVKNSAILSEPGARLLLYNDGTCDYMIKSELECSGCQDGEDLLNCSDGDIWRRVDKAEEGRTSSPSAASKYKKGDLVEYYSGSHKEWMDATVHQAGDGGRLIIDLKPNTWLSTSDVDTRIP